LRDAAEARAVNSLARARRAIITLNARGEPVTFTAVAAEAKVSLSYLYKQAGLASEIRQHRSAGQPPQQQHRVPGRSPASLDSLRTQLTVAAERLRTVEREVRDLRAENETLRGEVLDLRRRQHRTPRAPSATASAETRP
jgi:predicted  nucleic acid-binding Zn-ribbon protein